MPGQQRAGAGDRGKRQGHGQQAWLVSPRDLKVKVILRVKQRKQMGLFSESHTRLLPGPGGKS